MMNHPFWGMGWLMWLIPLLIIVGIYFFLKIISQKKSSQNPESPLDILKKRYANGEITKEQFEEMKKNI